MQVRQLYSINLRNGKHKMKNSYVSYYDLLKM